VQKDNHLPSNKKVIVSFLFIFLLTVITCLIVLASVPPVSRDALVHHLYIPKLYLQHGGIFEIPDLEFSYYPMNVDLLYLLCLRFGNDILPKYIHFFFSLVTSFLIYQYLKERISKNLALSGALFFLTIPIIIKLSITAYVDLGLTFFSFASIFLILKWTEHDQGHHLIVFAGIFAGLAAGTKYNGIIVIFLLTAFLPIIALRMKTGTVKPRNVIFLSALFLMCSLVVFSPWPLRNYIWTGNPLFPLFSNASLNQEGLNASANLPPLLIRKIVHGESWLEILLIPVRIFFTGQDDNPRLFDGKLNPFLLLLPLFSLVIRSDNGKVQQEKKLFLWFSILFFFIASTQAVNRARYIAPILPCLVVLSMLSLHDLKQFSGNNKKRLLFGQFLIPSVIAAAIGYNTVYLISQFHYVRPFSYLLGHETRSQYIARYRPEYPVIEFANSTLKPSDKILGVFLGNRGYYFDIPIAFDMGNNTSKLTEIIRSASQSADILKALHKENFSHLLIWHDIWDNWSAKQLTPNQLLIWQQFSARHTSVLTSNARYVLYQIKY